MSSEKKKLKILIVEDETIAATINCKMIEELGYYPDLAINGCEATKMSKNGYDLIFMDIGLPDIDGLAVTSEIRRLETNTLRRTSIVGLTGYSTTELHSQCLQAGMDDLAAKPITVETFQYFIDKL